MQMQIGHPLKATSLLISSGKSHKKSKIVAESLKKHKPKKDKHGDKK